MAVLAMSLTSVVMDARWCDGLAWRCFAPHGGWVVPRGANTRRRAAGDCGGAVLDCGERRSEARKMAGNAGYVSGHLAVYGRSQGRIGKKIIGRRCAIRRSSGGAGMRFGMWHGALALVDQPAGHGGRGVFFEPLVHQRADLLAKVGGVAEAGQFVALQAVARSGKQKLPGGLGAVTGHGNPPVGTGGTGRQH